MTRDPIPGLDLYRELEVSRQASVAAIEAAYRRLVKQHHPDVARSDDFERIKRLNLAREWLTDLDRRRQYDVSRGFSPTSAFEHGVDARAPRSEAASSEPARSFGVNATDVRIFLAGLRGLDSARARRVFDGRAIAHTKGYRTARRVAAEIGQSRRKDEWLLAREAASVIARGKLGDTTLTEQVVDVIADAAGAIAIRDLLSRHDFNVVMLPWTWTSARLEPAPTSEPRPAAPAPKPSAYAASNAALEAPDAVPAARWAEAFGSRWPPPGGRVVAADTVAPVASAPAIAAPVAAAPVGWAPAATSSSAPATPAFTTPAVSAAPSATDPVASAPQPMVEVAQPVASAPQPVVAAAPPVVAASQQVLAAAPPTVTAPPPTVTAPRAIGKAPDRTPSRISIADLGASPWNPSIEPEPKPMKAASAPRVIPRAAARREARRPSWIPVAALILVVIAVAGVVAALSRPPSEIDVAAITDDPLTPTNEATGFVVAPGGSDPATTAPTSTAMDPPTTGPVVTDRPGGGPPPPGPGATPKPPKPTPKPPSPTPKPPSPTPTPPPPPTPGLDCLVPNFINTQAVNALQKWTGSGFTGPLTLVPTTPPNYQIGWQSVAAGTTTPCTSGITVREVAP